MVVHMIVMPSVLLGIAKGTGQGKSHIVLILLN